MSLEVQVSAVGMLISGNSLSQRILFSFFNTTLSIAPLISFLRQKSTLKIAGVYRITESPP